MLFAFLMSIFLGTAPGPSADAQPPPPPHEDLLIVVRQGHGRWSMDSVVMTSETRVLEDGSWTSEGRRGQLSTSALRKLRRAITNTRFRLEPVDPNGKRCKAVPHRGNEVRTSDGRVVRWMSPCAQGPDDTVYRLVDTLERLIDPD